MSAAPPLVDPMHTPAAGTLGELLYRSGTSAKVSEAAWLALVQAVAGRDPTALRALYERTHRLVFTLTMRIVGNRATAEELTVDAFHEVWRRAPSYDPANGTVIGWLMNLTRSRAIDRLRFEHRQKRTAPAAGLETAGADTLEHSVLRHESAARLRTALTMLSIEERSAIEMAYFSDATYAEVAQHLSVPLGTIKTRIRSGLSKMRFALAGERAP